MDTNNSVVKSRGSVGGGGVEVGEGGLGYICYSINNNKKVILKRFKKIL